MDAGLPGHGDTFDVLSVDAEVGAPDGDGDSSSQRAETGDDLREEVQRFGSEQMKPLTLRLRLAGDL